MEDGACGQQSQELYLGSEEQSQEPRVCAAAVDGSPDPIRPTGPLHHARPVPGTLGLYRMASLGDVPGNS